MDIGREEVGWLGLNGTFTQKADLAQKRRNRAEKF